MDISLDEKVRVSYLDFMNGVGKTMTIFNQLEEEYKVLDERENENGKWINGWTTNARQH